MFDNIFPRVAIYTSILGGYDDLKPQIKQRYPRTNYICFTDIEDDVVAKAGWKKKPFSHPITLSNRLANRYYKALPDKVLSEFDITIYIDGTVVIRDPDLVSKCINNLKNNDLLSFDHPERRSVEEEVKFCLELDRFRKMPLREQLDSYLEAGFEDNVGLIPGGFLVRDNRNKKLTAFNQEWFQEIEYWDTRDQISLAFLTWKHSLKVNRLEGKLWDNEYFYIAHHNYEN